MSLEQIEALAEQVHQNHGILIQDHQKIKRLRAIMVGLAERNFNIGFTVGDMQTLAQAIICTLQTGDSFLMAYWTAVARQIDDDLQQGIKAHRRCQNQIHRLMKITHRITIHYNRVMDEQTRLNAEIAKLMS